MIAFSYERQPALYSETLPVQCNRAELLPDAFCTARLSAKPAQNPPTAVSTFSNPSCLFTPEVAVPVEAQVVVPVQ